MADQHDRRVIEAGNTTNDSLVITIGTVTVQFLEIGKYLFDIIKEIGALRVARQL